MPKLTLAAALILFAIQAGAQPFVGTWTAALSGKTYARLELRDAGGTLGGRVCLGSVHFDRGGDVTEVLGTACSFTPIFDVTLRDGVLRFARKDDDQTDRFELRLADGEALMTFLFTDADRAELASQGIANVKPVRLARSAAR
jgi:hypothetical protein